MGLQLSIWVKTNHGGHGDHGGNSIETENSVSSVCSVVNDFRGWGADEPLFATHTK